jgi:quinol monooxygenase YgiN
MHVCTINRCRVGEDHLEQLREVFADYTRQVAAHEPGCLSLRVLHEPGDPSAFVVYAEFTDEAAHQAHIASAHVARLREQLHPLIGDTHQKTILRPFV